MTRERRTYNVENVTRALRHHETNGALHSVQPPEGGQTKFRVHLDAFIVQDFTLREVYALCAGLAAAERAYTRPPADVAQLQADLAQLQADLAQLQADLERERGMVRFLSGEQEPVMRRYHAAQAEVDALRDLLRELTLDVFGERATAALASNPPDSWRHRLTRALAGCPVAQKTGDHVVQP